MYHIKNDKRAKQSSAMIYEALRELMAQKEYEAITITELVERSGVGRATFYRAFDTIDDVLCMKCDQQMEELSSLLLKEKDKPDGQLRGIRLFLRYWHEHSDVINLLYKAKCIEALINSFNSLFRKLLPYTDPGTEIPDKFSEYVFAMQSGAVLGLLMQWFSGGRDISPDEMAKLIEGTMKNAEQQHLKRGKCLS